jgi:hypothetical protein
MNIIGPGALVFGVDDIAACGQYLFDYGLQQAQAEGQARASKPWTAPPSSSPTRTTRRCRRRWHGQHAAQDHRRRC